MSNSTDQLGENIHAEYLKRAFIFVVPFNTPLCILVLAVCTTVLSYYRRNPATLTNTLFIMITAFDLITCVGHLILMVFVVLMSHDITTPGYVLVCVVIHTALSLLGYALSVFFNMVLAVLRTIKISFPFHQVDVGALKIAMGLVISFLVLFSVVDIWEDIDNTFYDEFLPWIFLWDNVVVAFVGHNMSDWFTYDLNIHFKSRIFQDLLAGLLYLVPICVVLVCLVIQFLVTRLRARARDPDQPLVTDWSHVNTTVSLLSAVFLFCNSGIVILQLYYRGSWRRINNSFAMSVRSLMISTTLPLLNSLLTPLIILSRSRELRGNVIMMIRRAFRGIPAVN